MELGLDNFASGMGGDYEGVNDLLKAIQAGHITGRDTADQSLTQEPLKIESLERTLKKLEFRLEKDVKLWNVIPKMTAFNTVEEYVQLESFGDNVYGGFYGEGENAEILDPKHNRRAELVKYIQEQGEVTLQAQLVNSFVDTMTHAVKSRTMNVIRTANRKLFNANSKYITEEWNGLYAQHEAIGTGQNLYTTLDEYYENNSVVVDLRGRSLTQEDIEDASVTIDASYADPSDLFSTPTVISALSKSFYPTQRKALGDRGTAFGTVAKTIQTSFGDVALNQEKMAAKLPARYADGQATHSKSPSAVAAVDINTNPAEAVTEAGSKFKTTDLGDGGALGTVFYAVAAFNRYGQSALTVMDDKVTTAQGDSIDIQFTDGGGAYPATSYMVYRSLVTAAGAATGIPFYPLFSVTPTELAAGYDGGAAGIVRDRGRHLPKTEQAFLTEMSDEILSFKQLAPVSKLNLAVVGPRTPFMVYLFGTPTLYRPRSFVRFINVATKVVAPAP